MAKKINKKQLNRRIARFIKKPKLMSLIGILGVILYQLLGHSFHEITFVSNNTRVVDGDTIILNDDTEDKIKIRLQGIDSPELKQLCPSARDDRKVACGYDAKILLQEMIGNNKVECTNEGRDKYGRQLSYCYAGDVFLNRAMVSRGYARAYSSFDIRFMLHEAYAKSQNNGLWKYGFEDPSKWRKRHKKSKPSNI